MKILPVLSLGIVAIFLTLTAFFVPPLFAQQNVNVSMVIPARAEDYTVSIEKTTPGTQFEQDETITYTVTYGSYLQNGNNFTIEAQWYPGVIQYSGSPTTDVLSYVYGSATDAYDNTAAVVDLQNKTIRWTFANFPADTQNQTVTFQLITTANYTGQYTVDVPVKARILGSGVTTDDSTVSIAYAYAPPPTPTPTPKATPTPIIPTATPNLTPGPTAVTTITPTPTPTTTPSFIQLVSVFLQSIVSSEATIAFQTNTPTTTILRYGKTPTTLTGIIRSLSLTQDTSLTMPNLSPNTQYYFQLVLTDKAGKTITSDIFSFKTALTSDAPVVDLSSIIIASDSKIFTTHGAKAPAITPPVFLLPQNTSFDIQFTFDAQKKITAAQIMTRNKFTLGEQDQPTKKPQSHGRSLTETEMVEIRPGIFLAKLKSPHAKGVYELYARLSDTNGNIVEQKIGELIASQHMRITDRENNPIENARVLLSVSKTSPDLFTPIGNHAIENPVFSNFQGDVKTILPPGRYKASVSALGYGSKEATFIIGQSISEGYPHIQLGKQPASFLNILHHVWDNLRDMLAAFFATMQAFAASSRVFDYTTMTLLWMFVIISFLAFSEKTHTHPKAGIGQLAFLLHHLFSRDVKAKYIMGTVLDKKLHTPLSHATVFVIDNNTRNVLFETVTNKKGSFVLKNPVRNYHLMSVKKGYEAAILYPQGSDLVYIAMHANTHHQQVTSWIWSTYRRILTMCFETLLLFSFILELFLTGVFGIEKTLPFILFSLINALLWIYYLSLKHHKDI